jgi:hypothetical protein
MRVVIAGRSYFCISELSGMVDIGVYRCCVAD